MARAYNLLQHGKLIADKIRTDSYCQALQLLVKPGSVVLDIGTGTGIFALFAARCGARKVYTVEPDDILQVARTLARANRLEDRIEFLQGLSTEVTLPERVDLIVFEIHGPLPLFERYIPTIIDARSRFLAPGGVLVPGREEIWAALVSDQELYDSHVGPFAGGVHGLDLTPARDLVVNQRARYRISPSQLYAEPHLFATLDYATISSPDVSAELSWTADRQVTVHGLALWFDSLLADGVTLSNAPWQPPVIFAQLLLPLQQPVDLEPGDTIAVRLGARLSGTDYQWTWTTRVLAGGDAERTRVHLRQSSFLAAPLAPATIRRHTAAHVPGLSEAGKIDACALELMGKQLSLGEIAEELCRSYPESFRNHREAWQRADGLADRYRRQETAAAEPNPSSRGP